MLQVRPSDPEIPKLVEKAVSEDPHRPEPLYLAGKLALQAGDLQRARMLLTRSENIDPFFPPVHYVLAQLYRRLRQPEIANRELGEYRRLENAHSFPNLSSLQRDLQR